MWLLFTSPQIESVNTVLCPLSVRESTASGRQTRKAWSPKVSLSFRPTSSASSSFTSSSSCSQTSRFPSWLGRTPSSSCWTWSSSCAASWRHGRGSSRRAELPTSAASDLHTGSVRKENTFGLSVQRSWVGLTALSLCGEVMKRETPAFISSVCF